MTRILTIPNFDGISITIDNPRDAFGYLQTTSPYTKLDIRNFLPTNRELLDDAEISGTGTSSSQNADGYLDLSVGSAIGDRIARSRVAISYQNGKAPIALFTGNFLTNEANVAKRVGLAYGNNFLFLENTNGNIALAFGSPTIGNDTIQRADWDDPLDGTGISKVNLDLTRNFIFFITFQYLGVGGLFAGFRLGLKNYIAYHFNKENSNLYPYWTTPNLFPTYGIKKTVTGGSASSLRVICATVINNGTSDSKQIPLYLTNNNSLTLGVSGVLRPLIYFRLNPSYINNHVLIVEGLALLNSSNDFQISIIRNPGGTAFTPTWVNYDSTSIQYHVVTQTDYNQIFLTVSNPIDVKFQTAGGNSNPNKKVDESLQLTSKANNTPDIFCLAIRLFNNNQTHSFSHVKLLEEI